MSHPWTLMVLALVRAGGRRTRPLTAQPMGCMMGAEDELCALLGARFGKLMGGWDNTAPYGHEYDLIKALYGGF